jgi:hypothetical protein
MRKLENAVVEAMAEDDLTKALGNLDILACLDRRRAWWAAFRIAGRQFPEDRRQAMIALVGKTYIARRTGRLIGVDDCQVLGSLARCLAIPKWERDHVALGDGERQLLRVWLPVRLQSILHDPSISPN